MSSRLQTFAPGLLLLISLTAFPGCYPPNQQNGQGTGVPTEVTQPIVDLIDAAEDLSVELKEKGLPDKVEAWVDDLIVTVQPGADMPEIARMKAGEKATYLHQRTLIRKEAVLRGQRFKARYILVRLSNGQMGWVHEGGIRYVYPRLQKVLDEVVAQATSANQRTRGGAAPATDPLEQRVIVPGVKVGPITKNSSQEELVSLYGGTQVGLSIVKTPEGDVPCTVIFPGEPSELRITWEDDNSRTRIKAVYIDKRESTWFTKDGLGVGLPLIEIAKVNQNPFAFYGLDWKYGGTIESWKNGTLGKYNKKFYGVVTRAKADQPIPSNLQGDKLISSNDPGVDEVELILGRMVIYLD